MLPLDFLIRNSKLANDPMCVIGKDGASDDVRVAWVVPDSCHGSPFMSCVIWDESCSPLGPQFLHLQHEIRISLWKAVVKPKIIPPRKGSICGSFINKFTATVAGQEPDSELVA